MPNAPYPFPAPEPGVPVPIWDGSEFDIAGSRSPVLVYDVGASGWNDELTALHEMAGSGGRHFIDVASRRHAIRQLKKHLRLDYARIIEVGVSAGHLLRDMQAAFPTAQLVGADYTLSTLRSLASKISGVPLIRFDLTKCPLPSNSFDAAVLLNVLEHIDNDEAAISHIARILKPGGIAVVEVPAGPELFDDYDRHLQHFRRYRLSYLCSLLEKAGLIIEFQNHLGALIYPAFRVSKEISKRQARDANEIQKHVQKSIESTSLINPIGHTVMNIEAALAKVVTFPAGIRCVVTARKQ